jgi:hypothetical protein
MFGEMMENRFFYELIAGVGSFVSLFNAITDEILPPMKAVQADDLTHVQMVIVNLDDVTDFGTIATGGVGARAGDPLPPHDAWGFTFFPDSRAMSPGGKRVAGPIEADVANGQAAGVAPPLLDTLALAFFDDIPDISGTAVFSPRLHRFATTTPVAPAVTVGIRSVLYRRVTTQSSRKFSD